MVEVKLASTIMLGRDNNGKLEILLLKRNKALAFAGGLWVFPGGKIDPEELAMANDEMTAAKMAAVREIKEEANLEVTTDQLVFFRHWTTPVAEPRRYATYFFFGSSDLLNSKVTIDDGEIKAHQWLAPQEAIDKLGTQEVAMMPPTLMSLQLIRKCTSVQEARELLEKETPVFILPILNLVDGKMLCMFEGDAGYETEDATVAGARHRLILDPGEGTFNFEFRDCAADIIPVNGGMHL